MKRLFLVEIDTTNAVSDIGDDREVAAWLKDAVEGGFGPAFTDDPPVRVLTPTGGSVRSDDPPHRWLRFPE